MVQVAPVVESERGLKFWLLVGGFVFFFVFGFVLGSVLVSRPSVTNLYNCSQFSVVADGVVVSIGNQSVFNPVTSARLV